MCTVEVLFLTLLLHQQKVPDMLHVDRGQRLAWTLEGPVVYHRSRRRSLSDLPASFAVLSVVLMVLTWCTMNPLDWGKWGEEVIWSM